MGNARCPRRPPPHRIPGARVAFPQAAEAAPARASIRVLARCSPGAAAAGRGGEGRTVPAAAAAAAAAAGGLLRQPEGTRITKENGFLANSTVITTFTVDVLFTVG
ncbi:uncharacterized protein LOC119088011 [Peromyscus leucopus]|uniref:uncharacterized protein LOC119088011 n=1 Tax=Peromyscus leucopus TaxID=10041 RepID=UPI001884AB56|nr:uncharacterized protein LOC119088011 [Peromyscus leucopus]